MVLCPVCHAINFFTRPILLRSIHVAVGISSEFLPTAVKYVFHSMYPLHFY